MKNTAIFWVLWLCALSSTAQQPTTTDRAIEGAKVVVLLSGLLLSLQEKNYGSGSHFL